MWNINGIGTGFCGKKNIANDGTYQTTKWIVILHMPIIPIKTYRIKEIPSYNLNNTEENNFTEFEKLPIKFDIRQVIETFLSYWVVFSGIILLIILLVQYKLYFPLLYFLMTAGVIFMIYEIFFKKK